MRVVCMPSTLDPDRDLRKGRNHSGRPCVYYIESRYSDRHMHSPAAIQRFLPLPPSEFQFRLAIADGERHGYASRAEVAERTDGEVMLGPGTLYGSIKRMLESGLIEESGRRPARDEDDDRRRYYRITSLGR